MEKKETKEMEEAKRKVKEGGVGRKNKKKRKKKRIGGKVRKKGRRKGVWET